MSLSNSVIYQGPSFRGTFLFIKGHRFVAPSDRLSVRTFRGTIVYQGHRFAPSSAFIIDRMYVAMAAVYVCMYAG
jgi:hypothetical protein